MSGSSSPPWVPYNNAVTNILNGSFNLNLDTLYLALATSAYTPSTSHVQWTSVIANEVATGGGYTAGGQLLLGQQFVVSGNAATFSCNNAAWSAFSATLEYGVIVRTLGGLPDQSSYLICYCDFGNGTSITGGGDTLTVVLSTGVLQVVYN